VYEFILGLPTVHQLQGIVATDEVTVCVESKMIGLKAVLPYFTVLPGIRVE
jgi:hypothetical protein